MYRSKFGCCTLLMGLALVSVPIVAQEFSELEKKLRQHPSLQQLHYQSMASLELASAAVALPDPELSLGVNNVPFSNPSFDRFLPTNKAIGVVQKIPSKAGRNARSARLREEAVQVDAAIEARFAQLRGELIIDLIELERIDRQRKLTLEKNTKYDTLAEVARAEISAGRPAVFRLAKIEGERAEVVRELVVLDGQLAQVNVSVIEKLGSDIIFSETSNGTQLPRVPTVTPLQWQGKPEEFHAVRVALLDVAIADQNINEAKSSWKTDWGIHVTYQQRSSGRGGSDATFSGDDWFSAGVTFSVPVWGKRKQAPMVRAAQAHRSSTQSNVRSMAQLSVAKYQNYRALHQTALASQRVLQQKIEAIESELMAQRTNYESGNGDYAPVIDGEIAQLTLHVQLATEKAHELSAIVRSNALLVQL